MQNSSKGISIAALICGLASFVMLFVTLPAMCGSAKSGSVEGTVATAVILPLIGFIAGVVGIILGATGMKKAGLNGEPKGLAIAGLVTGIVGAVFCGIVTLCSAAACSQL